MLALLAPLLTRIGVRVAGVVLVLLVVGAAYGYCRMAASEIRGLRQQVAASQQQAADLRATNADLLTQMRTIKAAEDEANASLLAVRRRASASEQALHRTLGQAGTTDPLLLEQALNKQQGDLLRQLQQDTR